MKGRDCLALHGWVRSCDCRGLLPSPLPPVLSSLGCLAPWLLGRALGLLGPGRGDVVLRSLPSMRHFGRADLWHFFHRGCLRGSRGALICSLQAGTHAVPRLRVWAVGALFVPGKAKVHCLLLPLPPPSRLLFLCGCCLRLLLQRSSSAISCSCAGSWSPSPRAHSWWLWQW